MKIIRKYALAGLLAMALACNANAKQEKVKWIEPVSDAGSTAALLGVSVAIIALARRKIATRVERTPKKKVSNKRKRR